MNRIIETDFENWHIQCMPDDGARISVLRYSGFDLLTADPPSFKPPQKFIGEFETRPVYGYDDCFPTVDQCVYPSGDYQCRDHGELCWQKWQAEIKNSSLICSTECLRPEVRFKRIMKFAGNRLTWRFGIENLSAENIYFLHVMHALMPPGKINSITLPEFNTIKDENSSDDLMMKNSNELIDYLLSINPGSYKMLLMKQIREGSVKLGFQNGQILKIEFDSEMFPTLGIWWNNAGYPEESGIQRKECAFEPIPGTCSDLSKSFRDGVSLVSGPGKTLSWEINWTIEQS